jgi:diguanylate cyclase (GGDEF)-like protein/PAS domain S-box-containing protein
MASARHSQHHKQALKRLNQNNEGYLPQRQQLDWKLQQDLGDCQHSQGELQDFIVTLIEFYPSPLAVISLETNQLLLTNCHLELLLNAGDSTAANDLTVNFFANPSDQLQLINQLEEGTAVMNYALQMKRVSGEVVDVLASAKAVNYQGQSAALLLLSPNTNPLLAAEYGLPATQWSSSVLATAVQGVGDAIEITEAQAHLEYVNPAFESIAGYTSDEVVGKTLAHFLRSGQHDESFYATIWQPLSQGQVWTGDLIGKHKDGSLLHQKATISPVFDSSGAVTHFVAVKRNVTQHNQSSLDGTVIYVNEAGRKLVGLNNLAEAQGKAIAEHLPQVEKQAETALRESEERFRAIAEALPEAMIISRISDGTILYANPQVESTLGLSAAAAVERKALDFYANVADQLLLLRQLKRDGTLQNYEVRLKKVDKTLFWAAVSIQFLTYNGEAALVSVFHDITSRRQAETRLQAIARQQVAVAELGQQALAGNELALLLNEATALVAQTLEVECVGVFKQLSGGKTLLLEAGLGWQPELIGTALVSIQSNSSIGYALLTEQPVIVEDFQIETRFSGPPLLRHHQVVSGVSVVIPGQESPFGVLGAYTTQKQTFTQDDVHFLQAIATVLTTAIERKQAEDRLHLMKRAIAASSNGIVLTDANRPDDPIIYVNPAFEKMSGYTANEVIGRNCRFLQGENRDQLVLQEIRTALQDRRECHVTLQNYRKDGTLIWNELYISPVFDGKGCLTHFIGIQTDITERKQAETALREQEAQYRRIVETATEGLWVLDKDNCTKFVNQQMAFMLGYREDEMLGKMLFAFMDDEGVEIAQSNLERRRQGICEAHDFKFRRKDGTDLWAIVSTAPFFDSDGEYAGALGMLSDITDRKQAEEALRKSEEQFRLMFELAPIGIALNSLDGHFLKVNQALCHALGYTPKELLNRTFAEITHADDLTADLSLTKKLMQGEIAHFQLEKRYIAKDGSIVSSILHVTLVRDAAGKPLHLLGQVVDITDRKRMETQLIHDAFHDSLTGLYNRVLFIDRLKQAITRSNRSPEEQFAVLFLDLDRFKLVNDSLGHLVGDQLLIAIAERLQSCLRACDTLARFGGDEFAILLEPLQTVSDATLIAERIQQALNRPLNLDGYEIFTTASIGIAFSTTGYSFPSDLLRDADTAMYCAKEQGKACYVLFDTDMYNQMATRLQLETDLRWAIERQELRVHYQPIVSLKTGQLAGFEALVRWQHPDRGLISPAEFIPIAEETGLIVPIGEWVLHTACQQTYQWQVQFPTVPLSISVNLSSKQLSQPHLVQQVDQILQQTGLAPKQLKLEITESSIMQDAVSAAKVLTQLKARNVQISIDDFGTGYSSLSRLHEFPIDTLKIDRSFISLISRSGEKTELVQAIIILAHSLGMDVVAEGVETTEQLARLRQLQCEYGQGYLFSKPLTQQAVVMLLASMSA